ncbi:MAG: 4-(cytidine 5'-diphospho)-2-C-methyl-D-erythritol kinase [Pseudomonadota bacterium]|nr:4-(cytidine 5'-diphospho)-2-C-methyl-D-erythritol kinase [Pseudomonadota bacterium]
MTDNFLFSNTANAKINLNLSVLGKRADGHHALDSLVTFAVLGDELSVSSSDELTLTYEGAFASDLQDSFVHESDDLVLKAATALQQESGTSMSAALQLTKSVPLGAGLGGGSADAAACLRLLNSFWKLDWSMEALMTLGANIGSDIPACLMNAPCRMTGRGEFVTKIDMLPILFCVLVNPGVHLSTADIFRKLNTSKIDADKRNTPNEKLPDLTTHESLYKYLQNTGNDLLSPAMEIAPSIGLVLEAISNTGADISAMTGSGSTCFGLFKDKVSARHDKEQLKELFPDYWVEATALKTN